MIQFKNIQKSFGAQKILTNISFDIPPGSFITLFGPNGCGKSTLMNILCGLVKPDAGEIGDAFIIKNKIGYVFQDYRRHLLPWLNGKENILFPLRLRGMTTKECEKKLESLQEKIHIPIDLHQKVFTLSGGQAQMISLMRALIIDPQLLILDEPFSAIDYSLTLSFRQKIIEVAQDLKLTTLFISHDLEEALYLGDQVVFLTPRPSHVERVLNIPFTRPRTPELLGSPEFAALKLEGLHILQHWQSNSIAFS